MLKILHLADLHLDSRFVGLSSIDAAKRRAELRGVFTAALEFAKKEGCAATLIAGDLFDGEYYTSDTLRFLSECFKSMPEHYFFITPGNHDPHGAVSPYRIANFPENVHIFDSERISCVTLDTLGLNVYGYAFVGQTYLGNPLDSFSGIKNNGYFNVLCAHTELDAAMSSYASISKKSLGLYGFDYAALGHIHTDCEIYKSENTLFAYSGCIAGRDFSEHGKKGGILLTLDEKNGKKTADVTRITLCPWVYEIANVSLDGAVDFENAISIISEKLAALDSGIEHIIRLKLTGEIAFDLSCEALLERLSALGVLDIKIDTRSAISSAELENDFTIRGAFYRALLPKLSSDDENERKTAELALKYGLTALGSGEINV